jgi:hypothetical protein
VPGAAAAQDKSSSVHVLGAQLRQQLPAKLLAKLSYQWQEAFRAWWQSLHICTGQLALTHAPACPPDCTDTTADQGPGCEGRRGASLFVPLCMLNLYQPNVRSLAICFTPHRSRTWA